MTYLFEYVAMVMWDLRGGNPVQSSGLGKTFWKRWCLSWVFNMAGVRQTDLIGVRATRQWWCSRHSSHRGFLSRSRACWMSDVLMGADVLWLGIFYFVSQVKNSLIGEELRIWVGRITNGRIWPNGMSLNREEINRLLVLRWINFF